MRSEQVMMACVRARNDASKRGRIAKVFQMEGYSAGENSRWSEAPGWQAIEAECLRQGALPLAELTLVHSFNYSSE